MDNRVVAGIEVSRICKDCDGRGYIGDGRYLPKASFKDHGGKVYDRDTCFECQGKGERLTPKGLEFVEFMEKFMGSSTTGRVSCPAKRSALPY